jgi:hypothetical protein
MESPDLSIEKVLQLWSLSTFLIYPGCTVNISKELNAVLSFFTTEAFEVNHLDRLESSRSRTSSSKAEWGASAGLKTLKCGEALTLRQQRGLDTAQLLLPAIMSIRQ